jgi:hypothetical protein
VSVCGQIWPDLAAGGSTSYGGVTAWPVGPRRSASPGSRDIRDRKMRQAGSLVREGRHLAGTGRWPLAGTTRQQTGPVQAPPAPADRRRLWQRRPTVPGDPRARLDGSYSTVRDYLDQHRPAQAPLPRRATGLVVVRQGPGARPRRRHPGPGQPVELRARRGPRQPHQNDQTPDVRAGRAAATLQTCPAHR